MRTVVSEGFRWNSEVGGREVVVLERKLARKMAKAPRKPLLFRA